MSEPELGTARLRLRQVREGDASELLAYYERNREHLKPWEPARPADFFTLASWEFSVGNTVADQRRGERRSFLGFAKDPALYGGRAIAVINLSKITRGVEHRCVLGYSIDERAQGAGLAREAVAAVVAYAFDTLGLHRIEANYQPHNERSGKLLRALGFTVEGYARDYLYLDGAWRDHVLTALANPAARGDEA